MNDDRTQSCSACGAENDILVYQCAACGAVLRNRVAVLDLFGTLWGVIMEPQKTLLHIARSERKNYVFLLYALHGPFLVAAASFVAHVGDEPFFSIQTCLFTAYILGPPVGVCVFVFATTVQGWVGRSVWRRKPEWKLVAALTAYVWSVFGVVSSFLVMMVLALFGGILFSTNPTPMEYKPGAFWVFQIFFAAALLYPLYQQAQIARIMNASAFRHALPTAAFLCVLAASVFLLSFAVPLFYRTPM